MLRPEVQIVPLRPEHIRPHVAALTPAQRAKLGRPCRVLRAAVAASSYARVALISGRPVALWGVKGTLASAEGHVWLSATDEARDRHVAFVREAVKELGVLAGWMRAVHTSLDETDPVAVRFARFLGFQKDRLLLRPPVLRIEACTIADLAAAPNLRDILAEYEREVWRPGMPPAAPTAETYQRLENVGMLRAFGVFWGEDLVGYLTVLKSVLPHYERPFAIVESFFVSKPFRRGGTGTTLRRMAEDYAREIGAVAILASAPAGGALAKILPRCGYREMSTSFYKVLDNA